MLEDKKEKIEYRSFEPAMSHALVRCVRNVYGDSYPLAEFYNPDYIENLFTKKLFYSEVAMTEDGEIVANLSTQLEQAGDYTADASAGMVVTRFRGHRALGQIGLRMAYVFEKLGLCGVQLYAITLHTITQGQISDGGGIVTGILPAHFPKGTAADGFKGASGRVGVVSFYLPLKKLPSRSVFIPREYKEQIHGIYNQIKCGRKELVSYKGRLSGNSIYEINLNHKTGVIRIRLDRVGPDMADVINFLDETARENCCEVQYVDIPLNDPGCGFAVDVARDTKFLYGALILERGGADRLRLQKLDISKFVPQEMQIASGEAKSFLNLIVNKIDFEKLGGKKEDI